MTCCDHGKITMEPRPEHILGGLRKAGWKG